MVKVSPKFLEENGKPKFVVLTIHDFRAIQEALEDAEDLCILEESKRRNAGKPLIPFATVKRELAARQRSKRSKRA